MPTSIAQIPIQRIIRALAQVAERWWEPESPYRQRAASIPSLFPYGMVSPMLDRLLQDWAEEKLTALLSDTFGSLEVLDGYHHGRRVLGYPRVVHILSATPLLGWSSLATALLVKSSSVAKLPSDSPLTTPPPHHLTTSDPWTPLFIETLREVDPEIGACVDWVVWDRSETERTRALLEGADAVVVYGSDTTVEAIRQMVRGETPLFAYGNRFALAIILQEADLQESARKLALDCVRLYQMGCLSPQIVLVEGDQEAAHRFAEELADAIADLMQQYPVQPDFGEAVAVRREREAALFEEGSHLWGADDLSWTVILRTQPRWETLGTFNTTQVAAFRMGEWGSGRKTDGGVDVWKDGSVWVWEYGGVGGSEISNLRLQKPKAKNEKRKTSNDPILWTRVQAVAIAGEASRVLPLLEPLCIPRICRVGELQLPPFDWYENGRRLLHDLARWSRVEKQAVSRF